MSGAAERRVVAHLTSTLSGRGRLTKVDYPYTQPPQSPPRRSTLDGTVCRSTFIDAPAAADAVENREHKYPFAM